MEGQITIGLPYKASCTLRDSMVRQKAGLSTAEADSRTSPLPSLKMTVYFWMAKGRAWLPSFARLDGRGRPSLCDVANCHSYLLPELLFACSRFSGKGNRRCAW